MLELLLSMDRAGGSGPSITPLPVTSQRVQGGGVVHNGYYYTGGGRETGSTLNTTFQRIKLDTLATWETMATPPTLAIEPSFFVYNDRIYVLTGYPPTGTPTARLYQYNPTTNAWTSVTSFTDISGDGIIQMVGPKVGGNIAYLTSFTTDRVAMYSFNMDTLAKTKVANKPVPSIYVRAGWVGDMLHILTGYDGNASGVSLYHLIYNSTDNTWRSLTDTGRVAVRDGGFTTFGSKLYQYGGTAGAGVAVTDKIYVCDTTTSETTWVELVNTDRLITGNPIVIGNNNLLSFGGGTANTSGYYTSGLKYGPLT